MLQPQPRLGRKSDTNGKLTLWYGVTLSFRPNNQVLLLFQGFCWAIWSWELRSWGGSWPVAEISHFKSLHEWSRNRSEFSGLSLGLRRYLHFSWIGQSRKDIGGDSPTTDKHLFNRLGCFAHYPARILQDGLGSLWACFLPLSCINKECLQSLHRVRPASRVSWDIWPVLLWAGWRG